MVKKPKGQLYTEDEIARILAMRAERIPVPKIAKALGRSYESVRSFLKKYRRASGNLTFYPRHEWTTEEEARLAEMRAAGCDYAQIATALGRSVNSVSCKAQALLIRTSRAAAAAALLADLGADHVFYVVRPGGERVPTTSNELLGRAA